VDPAAAVNFLTAFPTVSAHFFSHPPPPPAPPSPQPPWATTRPPQSGATAPMLWYHNCNTPKLNYLINVIWSFIASRDSCCN